MLCVVIQLPYVHDYCGTWHARPQGTSKQPTISQFFAEPLRDYVLQSLGRPVSLLQAGCLAPLRELGLGELAEGGFEISVTAVDDDNPLARRVLRETRSPPTTT